MQKYNPLIAKITFVSVFLIVLLSINFSIWGGVYTEDGLEYQIHQEMQMIEEGHISSNCFSEIMNHLNDLLSFCLLILAAFIFVKAFVSICCNVKNASFVLNTLFALSVRLNN